MSDNQEKPKPALDAATSAVARADLLDEIFNLRTDLMERADDLLNNDPAKEDDTTTDMYIGMACGYQKIAEEIEEIWSKWHSADNGYGLAKDLGEGTPCRSENPNEMCNVCACWKKDEDGFCIGYLIPFSWENAMREVKRLRSCGVKANMKRKWYGWIVVS